MTACRCPSPRQHSSIARNRTAAEAAEPTLPGIAKRRPANPSWLASPVAGRRLCCCCWECCQWDTLTRAPPQPPWPLPPWCSPASCWTSACMVCYNSAPRTTSTPEMLDHQLVTAAACSTRWPLSPVTWSFLAARHYIAVDRRRMMRRMAEVTVCRMTSRRDARRSGDASSRSYCRQHTSVASSTTCTELCCHSALTYVARPTTRWLSSSPSRLHELTWWPRNKGLIYRMQHSAQLFSMCVRLGLPYVLLSVLLETGVRTAIVRPTSKWFSNRRCELVGVPNYLSCVKTEVGLHLKGISL